MKGAMDVTNRKPTIGWRRSIGLAGISVLVGACSITAYPTPGPTSTSTPTSHLAPSQPLVSPTSVPGRELVRIKLPVSGFGVLATQLGHGDLWVAVAGQPTGQLYGYDSVSGRQRFDTAVGWAPATLALSTTAVWVGDTIGDGSQPTLRSNLVEAIDPNSGRVTASIPITSPNAILATESAVWVVRSGGDADTIAEIDPTRDVVTSTYQMPGQVADLSWALGAVWVTILGSDGTEALVRIDPNAKSVGQMVRLGGQMIGPIVAVGDALETVSTPASPPPSTLTLSRVDPTTGSLTAVATWNNVDLYRLYPGAVMTIDPQGDLREGSPLDGHPLAPPLTLPPLGDASLIDVFPQGEDVWLVRSDEAVLIGP
jgi:hypothetical protein